jgi:hypothetical protein
MRSIVVIVVVLICLGGWLLLVVVVFHRIHDKSRSAVEIVKLGVENFEVVGLHDQFGLAVEWCECCYEVGYGHLLGWVGVLG